MADYDEGFLDREPVHPGALIRNLLMPARKLDRSGICKILGVKSSELDELLEGKKDFTDNNIDRLREHYKGAALAVERLQMERQFYRELHRRPSIDEKLELFNLNTNSPTI